MTGDELIGIPWSSVLTFLRYSTGTSVYYQPLSMDQAVSSVESRLDAPHASPIHPGQRHLHARRALTPTDTRGGVVNDVHIAALACEHGGTVYSADRDFARIPQVRWVNPLT
ncbi:MAG: type II toxin-antitoxin system VapC family toxin [Candidatus Nanopelagicales bacterium]|nr:type II toxin-antitoxin system VapC family toxin [Candidatus Nanopelagicales bacterium]NKB94433.1 type II toxin-antitoxin system VapC family toxin [Candidatus Nanopelagicales bacterium]